MSRDAADLYSRVAPEYGQIGPDFFGRLGERLVALAGVEPGQSVLDLGAGRGASLFPAAGRVGSSGHVIGIDVAPGMVEATASDIAKRSLTNAEMRLMPAEQLDFPDTSFDVALGGFMVFWIGDPLRARSELRRVLKPGGRLAFSMASGGDPRWAWYDELLRKHEHEFGGFAAVSNDNGLDGVDGVVAWLREGGFVDVDVVREPDHEFVYRDANEWWASRWTHGSRLPLERMTPEAVLRFKTEAFEHLAPVTFRDGLHERWPLAVVRAVVPSPSGRGSG